MSRPADTTVPLASPADTWISRAAAGTVAALAGLAGAISYSHMRQLAQQHGQAGWHAHAFPLSVDGLEIVASLVLLADHRSGRRPGWLPWAALATGTADSWPQTSPPPIQAPSAGSSQAGQPWPCSSP
jgi:hypothetical protein